MEHYPDNFERSLWLEAKRKERVEQQKEKEEYKHLTDVQKFLEAAGINVWREVIPDQCYGWNFPYSVDLIFEINGYGLIGLEAKNLNTHGQGGRYAEAYLQIRDKYSNKTYFNGKKVKRWCVYGSAFSDMGGNRIVCFLKHFFNKLNIGFLEFENSKYWFGIVIDNMTKHCKIIRWYKEDRVYDNGQNHLKGLNMKGFDVEEGESIIK